MKKSITEVPLKGRRAVMRVDFNVPQDKETGENNFAFIQAEDELAAIGMVIGASWNGARAFTSTAGPGISLMNELLGLAYYAEIPAVVIDVQRVGPSTGMPTRTQQGDILECAYASHGDTKHILLFPSNPSECFELTVKAFDLAEGFQTPVFVLTRHPRPSIEMEGGTVFHFIDASPQEALDLAREAADGRDVRIGGRPANLRDFLAADLIDYLHVVVVPVLLGRGERLWDGLEDLEQRFEVASVSSPSGVTHLTFTR